MLPRPSCVTPARSSRQAATPLSRRRRRSTLLPARPCRSPQQRRDQGHDRRPNGTARRPSSTSPARLALIENSGTISATGAAREIQPQCRDRPQRQYDGVTIKQTAVAATFAAPSITGDVTFGTGSDTLDSPTASLAGNVSFGGGDNQLRPVRRRDGLATWLSGRAADTLTTAARRCSRFRRFRRRERHADDRRYVSPSPAS